MPHSKSSDSLRRQSILALLMNPLLVMVGLHAIAVRAMAVLADVAIAVLANVAFEVLANVAIAILALAVGVAIAVLARVLVVAIADVVHHVAIAVVVHHVVHHLELDFHIRPRCPHGPIGPMVGLRRPMVGLRRPMVGLRRPVVVPLVQDCHRPMDQAPAPRQFWAIPCLCCLCCLAPPVVGLRRPASLPALLVLPVLFQPFCTEPLLHADDLSSHLVA